MNKNNLSFVLEVVWWIFTLLLVVGMLFPIYSKANATYPFYTSTILFIVVFVTFTRYIFLLKYTFLAHLEKLKLAIILFSAITIFLLINELNFFQTYLDEKGLGSFLSHLSLAEQNSLGAYIRNLMIFFGAGSIIAAIVLPLRLVVSIWLGRNRGTV